MEKNNKGEERSMEVGRMNRKVKKKKRKGRESGVLEEECGLMREEDQKYLDEV
jgi:hypothetical protein